MTVAYISGPMRSVPAHNFPCFIDVEEHLLRLGLGDPDEEILVLNPARNFGGDVDRPSSDFMQLDVQHVLDSNVLVLLPGWEQSTGVGVETAVAKACAKEFFQAIPLGHSGKGESQEDLYALPFPRWRFEYVGNLPADKVSPRASALDEAKALITGDRNNSYGPPTQDFRRTADAANSYGYRGPNGRSMEPHDIAILVMLVKLSRLMWTPTKRDSWVDIAGYSGCGYECAVEMDKERRGET